MKKRILKFFFVIISLLKLYTSQNYLIYNKTDVIEFAEISEYEVNLTDYKKDLDKNIITNSYLYVEVNLVLDKNCLKNQKACEYPLRMYSKLNKKPNPQLLDFDKNDDIGIKTQSQNNTFITYQIEYSPCDYNTNDKLYLTLLGFEGKSKYDIKISLVYNKFFEFFCSEKNGNDKNLEIINPPSLTYFASVLSEYGTIRYGGIFNKTIDDNLYLFNSSNQWEILTFKGKEKPKGRYGHNLFIFENLLILFGGKDINDNVLNDLWIFEISEKKWYNINYITDNIGINKFLSSGIYLQNFGKILIYGGAYNFDDKNLYLLNLKHLYDIFKLSFKKKNYSSDKENYDMTSKIKDLWQVVKIEELTPRYGLTITQINDSEVMFFGGVDRNFNTVSILEILNLDNFQVKILEPKNTKEFPSSRAFHNIIKIGEIAILLGGEDSNNEQIGEMWKFVITSYKWIKLEINRNFEIFLKRSNFFFTKITKENKFYERPIIYGGYSRNKETKNNFLVLNFDICENDISIISKTICLPCTEGYVMNKDGECEACPKGYYQDIPINKINNNIENYLESTCKPCPKKTYNDMPFSSGITSCKLCDYGFYNNLIGQTKCLKCNKDEICLSGSENPIKENLIEEIIISNKILENNYPDFLDSNNDIQFFTKLTGFLVIVSINFILLVCLAFFYIFHKKKVIGFLIHLDFIPLTGGVKKKSNGGLVTLIYSAIIISFAIFFLIKYFYFNQQMEVISLTHSIGDMNKKDFSMRINIDLIGYEFNCINPEMKVNEDYFECHPDIEISKVDKNNIKSKFIENDKNNLLCKKGKNKSICNVQIMCKECQDFKNEDQLEIYLRNELAFVQAYNWGLESFWADDFIKKNGYSRIYSSFHAYNDVQSGYVFKGDSPSYIEILFNPIFYNSLIDEVVMKGYKANYRQYKRGSTLNAFNFFNGGKGVKLRFKFFFSNNFYQLNKKHQFDFVDFLAFILGMLAGFSFISRISKFLLEKWNLFNYSEEDYIEFREEREINDESSTTKQIPLDNMRLSLEKNSERKL